MDAGRPPTAAPPRATAPGRRPQSGREQARVCARTRARPVRPARTRRHGRHADGTRGLFGGLAGGRVHARRAKGWDCCHRRRRGGRRGRRHCDYAPHFRARPHARRGERGFCGFDLAEGQQQALSHRAALPRLMVESPRHEPEHHASGGAAVLAEAPAVVGRGQSASKRARGGGGGGGPPPPPPKTCPKGYFFIFHCPKGYFFNILQ